MHLFTCNNDYICLKNLVSSLCTNTLHIDVHAATLHVHIHICMYIYFTYRHPAAQASQTISASETNKRISFSL